MLDALCNAYILHIRPYKDSSAILECLTEQHGLISLLAKGAKRPKSRLYGILRPFILLEIAWVGRSELKTLTVAEAPSLFPLLTADKIALGLYLNELLINLMQRLDPHPLLFNAYHQAITELSLADKFKQQIVLRQFEKTLLAQMGYGLELTINAQTKEKIIAELLYGYDPAIGIFEASVLSSNKENILVSGASLLALENSKFTTETELQEAKKFMRHILAYYLGNKPLHSRKLFQRFKVNHDIPE